MNNYNHGNNENYNRNHHSNHNDDDNDNNYDNDNGDQTIMISQAMYFGELNLRKSWILWKCADLNMSSECQPLPYLCKIEGGR